MSQLKKGAALSYITIILTNGIGLVMTPFIIRHLGTDEYGLYTLIGSMVGYISVMDFGLNNTIVRFVAKYRAMQDRKSEENFLATTMLIYGVISAVIVLIGLGLYFNLADVFKKLTPEQLGKARIMFGILILNLAVTLPGGAFTAICSAYEHFVFPRSLNIVKYVTRSLMVIGLLTLGGDSVGMVILDTAMNFLVIAINGYYIFRRLKVRFKLHEFEWTLVKRIFSYSVWIFIFAMVGQFQWRSGQMILGVISTPADVAIYGVGILLGTYYGAFSGAISGVFLPRATKMVVLDATPSELTSMMVKIGRFSLLILLLILGGFLIFGHQFVLLWVGPTYSDSWLIALVIMFSYTLPLVQTFANSILEAKSKFSFKAIIYIAFVASGTAVGAYLVRFYGPPGIMFGCAGGWLISQFIMNMYYKRVLHLEIARFFKELTMPIVPVFIVTVAIGYAIDLIPGEGWTNLVIKIILFATTFMAMMFKFGLNEFERGTFTQSIPFLHRKKR